MPLGGHLYSVNVDVLIVLKDHKPSDESVNLCELSNLCFAHSYRTKAGPWRLSAEGPDDWAWGHVRVEALISSRTPTYEIIQVISSP
jgi:hypothetical protein